MIWCACVSSKTYRTTWNNDSPNTNWNHMSLPKIPLQDEDKKCLFALEVMGWTHMGGTKLPNFMHKMEGRLSMQEIMRYMLIKCWREGNDLKLTLIF